MKRDIILAGVGGQGILSIAAVIGFAALEEKLYVKQSEVHGMSQRGGEVQAHLRLSTNPIASDLIPEGKADLIIGMEPMETLRYLNFLKPEGYVIVNAEPFINIEQYPDVIKIEERIRKFPNHILFNADKLARKCGSVKASNMVLLGATVDLLGLKKNSIEKAIKTIFSRKGNKVLDTNLSAYEVGLEQFQKLTTPADVE
jgi:indolepyruvate ferredoxin oxidoreductase beta subunit